MPTLEQIILKHRALDDHPAVRGFSPNPLDYAHRGNDATSMGWNILNMLYDGLTQEVGPHAARGLVNMVNNLGGWGACGFVILSGLQRMEDNGWAYDGFRMTRQMAYEMHCERAEATGDIAYGMALGQYSDYEGAVTPGHMIRWFLNDHIAELDGPIRSDCAYKTVAPASALA